MFKEWHQLKKRGVLGINARNANFILKYNPRKAYPLVDDKLKTKELAKSGFFKVPKLYGVIDHAYQIGQIQNILKDHSSCVIKPASGSGGQGVLVLKNKVNGQFVKANGQILEWSFIEHHLTNILSGLYSLGGINDKAIIEYCVKPDPTLKKLSYEGVPDIRIIVFLGYPVMAMMRLATKASDGKANLHQKAVGVGIDLKTGQTTQAIWQDQAIDKHPDYLIELQNQKIEHWPDLLLMAANIYELTQLGYFGVDIVLDEDLGPLILEINARPGLSIQIANQQGLSSLLKTIEKEQHQKRTSQERVDFSLTT